MHEDHWLATRDIANKYREECLLAANDTEVFKTFRQLPYICGVIENRPAEWMPRFLGPAAESLPDFARVCEVAAQNDTLGSPMVATENGVTIAPTTACYVLGYAQMVSLFGPLDGMHIAEIGGGYGGQAAVITGMAACASYTIFDIPEPCALQSVFIGKLGRAVQFVDHITPARAEYDLVISSCALSELDEAARLAYVAVVLSRAKRGWLAWNYAPEPTPGWIDDPRDAKTWLESAMPGREVTIGSAMPAYQTAFGSWTQYQLFWGQK